MSSVWSTARSSLRDSFEDSRASCREAQAVPATDEAKPAAEEAAAEEEAAPPTPAPAPEEEEKVVLASASAICILLENIYVPGSLPHMGEGS